MRIVVVGCGGVGGILAARLTRAGRDVTPVTGNAAIAAALVRDGYRVREYDGTEWSVAPSAPPRISLDAASGDEAPFDLCVVATKATTLAEAVRATLPNLRPGAPIVCCQNGLPEEIAARVAGRERVLGCVVVFGATMEAPGRYVATSRGGLQLGRPFAESPDAAAWAGVLDAAAPTAVVSDLQAVRWSKLALNCATSTLGAIGGMRLGALLRRRFVRRLVLELWTEVVEVARASGVTMAPIGGTLDVAKMALTPAERQLALGSPALAVKHSILLAVGMKYRRMRSSMLVALERGRTPEIEFLNGEIVRRGETLGVPTPINTRLVEEVRLLAAGRGAPSIERLRAIYDEVAVPRAAAAG